MCAALPKGGSDAMNQQRQQAPGAQAPDAAAEQPSVPQIGWMWASRTDGAQAGGGGATTSLAAARLPSAARTVANLKQDRIKAKKSLGQNFVTDDSVLQEIVAAAGVGPGDLVLEIGPGTGNLTKHLLQRGARVTAVEKDDTLYGRLVEQYHEVPELQVINGDALTVGLPQIIQDMLQQNRQLQPHPPADATTPDQASASSSSASSSTDSSTSGTAKGRRQRGAAAASPAPAARSTPKVKVVANLPYNITKELLVMLLPLGDSLSDLHIMIQHEVGERLTQKTPGGPAWRAMNVRTLYYSRPKYRFRISRLKYSPVPGVDGALVTFQLLPNTARHKVPSERMLNNLVNKAFSERRKMMRNSLQPMYSSTQVEAALSAVGVQPTARAQDLTVEQFVAVSWQLHQRLVQGLGEEAAAAAIANESSSRDDDDEGEEA